LKISINYKIHNSSWGGGNQFVKSLEKHGKELGHDVKFDLKDNDIDIILLIDPRSYNQGIPYSLFEIFIYVLFINPKALIVHRINECDERKNTRNINFLLRESNKLADHTIFISSWLKELDIYQKGKPSSVILNGADQEYFNNFKNKNWDKKSPLKIVTHHWSANYRKGFDVYEKLDNLLLNKNWENKIEFTYIGNLPDGFKFKKSKHLPPMNGKKLGEELSRHHIYITASQNEPAGMHHIEGVLCGLPIIYRNSGALPEYCEYFGIAFENNNFIPAIENMFLKYDIYKEKTGIYKNNSLKMTTEYLHLFLNLLSKRDFILAKRKLWKFPVLLFTFFLIYIYGIKNFLKKLFYFIFRK